MSQTKPPPSAAPSMPALPNPVSDKRFKSEAWQTNPVAQLLAQQYLWSADWMRQQREAWISANQTSAQEAAQMRFYSDQMIEASSPSNFLVTNPEAMQALQETHGESLQNGLANLLNDLRKGRVTQTDESAFAVGENLAVSPGAVVFENEFFQLLQYSPSTATVFERPILMVPPSINKYYILDLHPDTSFVKYAVAQGQTVFLVSWRNPVGQELNDASWDDYVSKGVITAILAVQAISGQKTINTLGFCVGGTLLAVALAALAAKGQHPAHTTTLLTTLLDFSQPGILGVFTDEAQVQKREAALGNGGLMPAKDLNNSFSALRPNDLIWNYVVNQYLKGAPPAPAFDLLYWNGDSTNLPGPMFAWYLRNMYLENRLATPNRLQTLGQSIDLGLLGQPFYVLAAKEDHIVPWQAAHASACLLGAAKKGHVRYVQGAAGHIAGVINPAHKNKRSYKLGKTLGSSAAQWEASASDFAGSWWLDWTDWLNAQSGKKVKAKKTLGNAAHPVIEPAPGRYVAVRAMPL